MTGLTFGSPVTVTLGPPGWEYDVTGTLEAITPAPDGDYAVVLVTAGAGLCRAGTVITPRLADITAIPREVPS